MTQRLTKEQSQHLIKLGVPKQLASEIQEFDDDFSKWTHNGDPIFTLDDMFKVVPEKLDEHPWFLNIEFERRNRVTAGYKGSGSTWDYHKHRWPHGKTLIEALYELACWYYGIWVNQKIQSTFSNQEQYAEE